MFKKLLIIQFFFFFLKFGKLEKFLEKIGKSIKKKLELINSKNVNLGNK